VAGGASIGVIAVGTVTATHNSAVVGISANNIGVNGGVDNYNLALGNNVVAIGNPA
jgi:hypothetical protein